MQALIPLQEWRNNCQPVLNFLKNKEESLFSKCAMIDTNFRNLALIVTYGKSHTMRAQCKWGVAIRNKRLVIRIYDVQTFLRTRCLRCKRKASCDNQNVHFALGPTPIYKKLVFIAIFAIGRYFQLIWSRKMIFRIFLDSTKLIIVREKITTFFRQRVSVIL